MKKKRINPNAAYVIARNELIPIAEAHANQVAGKQTMKNIKAWNLAYFAEMDRLAKEKGLTR